MSAKIKKSLIILVIVLAVLILAAVAIAVIPKLSADEGDELTSLFTITDPVSVAFGGSEVEEYVLTDGTWCYAENTSWPIKQNGVTRIVERLSEIIPSRSLEVSDSLAAYGIEPAQYTLTVTDANGKSETVYIGNTAGESGVYAMTGDKDVLYILPTDSNIVSYVASTIYNMLDPELPASMGENAISEMTVSYGGKSATFTRDADNDSWSYLMEDGTYVVEEEYSAIGSDGKSHTVRKYLNDVGEVIPDVKSKGVKGYECSDAELSDMGFDDPVVLEISKTDGTFIVYRIGGSFTDDYGTEYSCFTVDGNPAVFYMPAASVAPFIELVNVLGR
ncbi:MAG: DUF4340 domain-containing protein [Oscillospiraceae bacterium]|nr:DUF4340 domain-containing protein [Oscillospiraceae bacterium]